MGMCSSNTRGLARVSNLSIAQDLSVSAIRDQANDLMGCFEALQEYAESNQLSERDYELAAEELSAEFDRIADWLKQQFENGAVTV